MKTFKILITTTLVLGITGIFNGCKKDTDIKPVCRIINVSFNPSGGPFNLSYNSDGKISRAITGTNVTTYTYTGNTTIVTLFDAGTFNNKKIITMNAAGLATNIRTENNIAGTDWLNDAFEYNGEEISRSTHTASTGGSPTITTYTWSNHNLVSETLGSITTTYDYYTDKPRQNGDFLSLLQLIGGYEVYRNKNLLKSFNGTIFTYNVGTDGNISSAELTSGSSVSFIDYQYQCN
jgi:hypothetical protein